MVRRVGGPALISTQIVTDRGEYAPLDPVIVTTTNHTSQPLFNDRCVGEIEGFEYLGEWNGSYGSASSY